MRLAIVLLGLLSSCEADRNATSLFQDVGMSFEPCTEAEVRNLNDKHQFMPALKLCGSNNVAHYAWNPAGTHLYFDLTMTGNVLDASQKHKPLSTLPIDQPTGQPTWVLDHRIAIPIVPDHKDKTGKERVALYDIRQFTLEIRAVPDITGIDELSRSPDPNVVYFTGFGTDGTRGVYSLSLADGSVGRPFPWLTGPVKTFTYTYQPDILAVGRGDRVELFHSDGTPQGSFAGQRGTVHKDGKWLALERPGEEVSIFYQRAWDAMSRRERELAERRAKELGQRFPDWYPKTIQLPTLEFVDLSTGLRGESRSFYGTRFQWYEKQDFWGSFVLWGYEGKQFNRNVMLGNLTMRLGAISHNKDVVKGVSLLPPVPVVAPAAGTPDATTPTAETPTAETPAADAPNPPN
ncbi:MAG: hypothetical protein AB8H79_26760 [Myxococcota bacterium]